MTKPSIWRRMGGRLPKDFGGRQGQSAGGGRRNGEKPPPRVGLKEAHAGLQPYPPKGTPNPANGKSESESWVATGEFGVTTEDRRRAAGSF